MFLDSKVGAKVWLNLMPGTVGTLSTDINMYHNLKSFPVVSYVMRNQDGKDTHARLFPPAEPGRKYGLGTLGLCNTLAIAALADAPPIAVDPGQLVRCTRYCHKSTG